MRSLPTKRNPLIQPEVSPSHEELLSRRRLGSTELKVKADHVGTSNATRPENLGIFEYAHLRAPLPKNLKDTEIFPTLNSNQPPETYFLMRRSKDGYVSATGMFKIAFPWAKQVDEKLEREYLRGHPKTGSDEIAGNLWIPPEFALELAEEYQMASWIRALLDPADIPQGPPKPSKTPAKTSEQTTAAPPKFNGSKADAANLAPPAPSAARTRSLRSASPSRVKATPRKRQTKAQRDATTPSAAAVSETLQSSLDAVASVAESVVIGGKEDANSALKTLTEVNGEREVSDSEGEAIPVQKSSDRVKINVESETTVDPTEDLETTRTHVTVEMPNGLPELPLPDNATEMIAKAKEMVEEAVKLQEEDGDAEGSKAPSKPSRKRKIAETEENGAEFEAEIAASQPAKKARLLEARLRRERVRNRALLGVTATLAIAAAIPYFF